MRLQHLLISGVLLAASAAAQQPVTPDQIGTVPLTGEAAAQKNTMVYGLNSIAAFDDNVPNGTTSVNNFTSSFSPNMSVTIDRKRTEAFFYYSPTYTYSSNVDAYNALSQAAAIDLNYRFNPRWSIQLRDNFSRTTNSYENLQAANNLPPTDILDRPNSSVLGTNLRNTTNLVSADSTYRLGPKTSIGIGGSFLTLQYQTPGAGSNVTSMDSRSWSGHASYSQQLTPRYTLSVQYAAQNFSSQSLYSTLTHSVLGFWTASFSNKIKLSVFGGPQLSQFNDSPALFTTGAVPQQSNTNFSGGANFSWQGEHNGMTASFVQRVSDGGAGGGAAVNSRMVTLALQRHITPRLTASLFSNYAANTQLDPLSRELDFSSVSGGVTLTRMFSEHWSFSLSGFRQAFPGNAPQAFLQHDHDAVTVSLSYSFARPIGR